MNKTLLPTDHDTDDAQIFYEALEDIGFETVKLRTADLEIALKDAYPLTKE